jgi:hypothetical protein
MTPPVLSKDRVLDELTARLAARRSQTSSPQQAYLRLAQAILGRAEPPRVARVAGRARLASAA